MGRRQWSVQGGRTGESNDSQHLAREAAELTAPPSVDRRSAIESMLLLAFGLVFSSAMPSRAFAKARRARYKIVFKLRGGKNRSGQVRYVRKGGSISVGKLKKPKRKGYKFVGWYADAGLSKPAKRVRGKARAAARTIHAKWKIKTYKIVYDYRGGVPTVTMPTKYTVKTPTITPIAPTKDGYRFAGWYKDAKLKKKRAKIKKGSTGKAKLFAKWVSASYWNAYLEAKCAEANKLASRLGDRALCFVFITDMHVTNNSLVSPYLVKQVLNKTDANMVVFGGDAVNFSKNKSEALDMIRFVRNAFGSGEFHFVRGNHDANNNSALATAALTITDAEFAAVTAGPGVHRKAGALYYHRDVEASKVRLVFLDSGAPNAAYVDDVQLQWLQDVVCELDESWTVLIFVHQFFQRYFKADGTTGISYDKNGTLIKAAVDGFYDDAKARIAGIVSGHCHYDYFEYSEKGYPMVATTTDAYAKANQADGARRCGALTEQAFDIVYLDTESEMLYFKRVGAGGDRSLSYAPPEDSDDDGTIVGDGDTSGEESNEAPASDLQAGS